MLLKQFHQNLIETFYQPKCWEIVIMTHQNKSRIYTCMHVNSSATTKKEEEKNSFVLFQNLFISKE
jgi:hypothetical protein